MGTKLVQPSMSESGEGSAKEERKPGDGRGHGGPITNFVPLHELPRFLSSRGRAWRSLPFDRHESTSLFGPLSTEEEAEWEAELSPHDPLSGSDKDCVFEGETKAEDVSAAHEQRRKGTYYRPPPA